MYIVYILCLKNGDLYKGYTQDLERRLEQHNLGKVSSTKFYRPLKLIHFETYIKQSDALRREKFLKTTEGRRLLRQQLRDILAEQYARVAELVDLPAGRQARTASIYFTSMYYTYVLKSEFHKYRYIGITDDPNRRLSQHNRGKSKTTKRYLPFTRIVLERFSTRVEARKREKYLKSGVGREFLDKLEQGSQETLGYMPEWRNW